MPFRQHLLDPVVPELRTLTSLDLLVGYRRGAIEIDSAQRPLDSAKTEERHEGDSVDGVILDVRAAGSGVSLQFRLFLLFLGARSRSQALAQRLFQLGLGCAPGNALEAGFGSQRGL
ncbi:hypothetical protein D3C71_999560 [compost metagenome]